METELRLVIVVVHSLIAMVSMFALIRVTENARKWIILMGLTVILLILDVIIQRWWLVPVWVIAIAIQLIFLMGAIRKANGPRIKGFIIVSQITQSENWYLNKYHHWEPNQLDKVYVFSAEEKDNILVMVKDNKWQFLPTHLIPAESFKGVTKVTGEQIPAYPATKE